MAKKTPMNFDRAKQAKVFFGKYKDKTLDEIATLDLRYLAEFLGGECEIKSQYLQDALVVFLGDKAMAQEIEECRQRNWK